VRIGVLYSGPRIVELVVRSHKVKCGKRVLQLEEDGAPFLRHSLQLGQDLLQLLFAPRSIRLPERDDRLGKVSPVADIDRPLEHSPFETFERRVRGNCGPAATGSPSLRRRFPAPGPAPIRAAPSHLTMPAGRSE